MKKIYYDSCPLCGSASIYKCLTAKDHTVTGEWFEIWECGFCTTRFTQDIPSKSEIQKYYKSDQYISHTNTRKGLINKLYHFVRTKTLQDKKRLIHKVSDLRSGYLLDVGSGTGEFVKTMQDAGWQVTGLEPDITAREKAEELKIKLYDIPHLLSLQEKQFDVITLWHVLEHMHDVHEELEILKKLLKPGGFLIIAAPNYTSADAAYYKENWAAYDVPRHLYHFSPAAMKLFLKKHGLAITDIYPQWFDSYYVSLLSEHYQTGTNHFVKGIIHGFISNLKTVKDRSKCSSLIYVATGA